MSSVPLSKEELSLKISEVLGDVGVNDEMIMKRRNGALFDEAVCTLRHVKYERAKRRYVFGSQSEGSTTLQLKSDKDVLYVFDECHVINDWTDWKQGAINLMMVQDETTAPGYCLLWLLQPNVPLPAEHIPDAAKYFRDEKGRILLKNTVFQTQQVLGWVPHGPALNNSEHIEGYIESDIVPSLHCKHWPVEGRGWLGRHNVAGWPTAQMKSESEKSGCFLVAVDSKINGLHGLEWRISTSLDERYLMFSLNVPQIKCYVLVKMLIKSNPVFTGVITSYMCKTILFYCVENTEYRFWQDQNLIRNIVLVLRELYKCIQNMNCPHFIIPGNNLMADKFTQEQQQQLLELLHRFIDSDGLISVLFNLPLESFRERLKKKVIQHYSSTSLINSPMEIKKSITAQIVINMARIAGIQLLLPPLLNNSRNYSTKLTFLHLLHHICKLKSQYIHFDQLEKDAFTYENPQLCSRIGSLIASYNVSLNRPVPNIVFQWLKKGVDSDVSSGWLKLATVRYIADDMEETEKVLCHVERMYDKNAVMPVCAHDSSELPVISEGFRNVAMETQVTDIRHIVSFCVSFLLCEVDIAPRELKQEFVSLSEDMLLHGNKMPNELMSSVFIDSLPYLYFLQYKTYDRLRNRGKQTRALHELRQLVRQERNLFHKETALNLLGQCMEQENLPDEAFHCYERSLQVKPINNAASVYMSRMMSK